MVDVKHYEESQIYEILKEKNKFGLAYGWAQAFIDKKMIHNGPNLIVSRGREFMAQRLFGTSTTSGTSRFILYNHKISHFAVGSGGATSPTSINAPELEDTSLSIPITLAGNLASTNATHTVSSVVNGGITYDAVNAGDSGNSISIRHVNPGVVGTLSITVISNHIEVELAHNGSAITTTATELAAAIAGDVSASALVTATPEGTGSGLVAEVELTYLSGGQDYEKVYLEEPSNYSSGIYDYRNAVKPITTDGELYLVQDDKTKGPLDLHYTKMRCACIIPAGEPLNTVQVSEAGLYFVNDELADSEPNKVQLFSRICFSPRSLTTAQTFTLLWYILC